MDRLAEIWNRLLPHRKLDVGANNLKVAPSEGDKTLYDAGNLSDGERVIFYMIGQCLLCPNNTLIIIDEPELHINKAILHLVYDEIEAERKDCGFVYITHDLDFAISRQANAVYAVKSCRFPDPGQPNNCQWAIALVPEETGLDEEFVATIVGSRQAILFVEGRKGKLDSVLYRWLYPEFTVLPTGACEAVIHSVVTFNAQKEIHRYRAVGLIDYDHRSSERVDWLRERRINVLPVSEAENLILIPDVLFEIALIMHYTPEDARMKINQIVETIIDKARTERDAVALRKTKRRLDDVLKGTSVSDKNIDDYHTRLKEKLGEVDPKSMFEEYSSAIDRAVSSGDLETLLREVDDKGLVDIAARILGLGNRKELQDFLGRALRSDVGDNLAGVMRANIPALPYD